MDERYLRKETKPGLRTEGGGKKYEAAAAFQILASQF